MKQFTALVIFDTWDEAVSAERALNAAGYSTQILGDIAVPGYGLPPRTTWMDVWRPSEAKQVWCDGKNKVDPRFDLEVRQLDAIVEPLGGFVDQLQGYGLVEYRQPRDEAYPVTWTQEEGYTCPRAEYRH
jgi:hypothetical protein